MEKIHPECSHGIPQAGILDLTKRGQRVQKQNSFVCFPMANMMWTVSHAPVTTPSPLWRMWTSCHNAFLTLMDVDFLSPRPPQSDGWGLPVTMPSPLWRTWTSCHYAFPTRMDVDFLSPRLFHSDLRGLPAPLLSPHWGTGAFPLSAPFARYFATVTRNWLMFLLYLKQRIWCEWRHYTWVSFLHEISDPFPKCRDALNKQNQLEETFLP